MKRHISELHEALGKSQGLTHAAVAREVGIARSTYTKILNGSKTPSLHVAGRLAEFFKFPLGNIAFGPLAAPRHEAPAQGDAA